MNNRAFSLIILLQLSLGFVALAWSLCTHADDGLNRFYSELSNLEQKQALQKDHVYKYTDAQEGENIHQLLNPNRTKAIMFAYVKCVGEGHQCQTPPISNGLDYLTQLYSRLNSR